MSGKLHNYKGTQNDTVAGLPSFMMEPSTLQPTEPLRNRSRLMPWAKRLGKGPMRSEGPCKLDAITTFTYHAGGNYMHFSSFAFWSPFLMHSLLICLLWHSMIATGQKPDDTEALFDKYYVDNDSAYVIEIVSSNATVDINKSVHGSKSLLGLLLYRHEWAAALHLCTIRGGNALPIDEEGCTNLHYLLLGAPSAWWIRTMSEKLLIGQEKPIKLKKWRTGENAMMLAQRNSNLDADSAKEIEEWLLDLEKKGVIEIIR